ncbi:multiheme c-type cytochrome [Simiduia curdlanivorans]|uniref:Multiheme c-type cytochrome n=1 Tax=Simiduia curdlanivorans TaxID=1492769 RepID=A0ABV8V0K6_9GAMM|nr:multiheme c-type cytochrome [Simiduia curdlanivorans]MDN3640308.1 multiheme c-type cytochrome [Simiduia curdlanivorans]
MTRQLRLQIHAASFFGLLLSLSSYGQAAPLTPDQAPAVHNGVASCATSACHGKVAAVEGRNVWLNEYHIWSTQDRHSRAYQTLLTDRSKAMAQRLGLGSAHTAKACLDCHADNVAAAQRGQKFQLSDGVSCEACHGGSEKWLKSHTEPQVSHADNIANGLYPTENALDRSALCLSCHKGTGSKFADHTMMAAGHPRLTFELDTFTANQPGHYKIDADYQARKGKPAPGSLWMLGQMESGKRSLALIQQHAGTLAAENLAIYDCHSCHRPMNPARGQAQDDSRQLPAGSIRLEDSALDMIAVIFKVLWPEQSGAWHKAVAALHKAQAQQELALALTDLDNRLVSLEAKLRQQAATAADLANIRRQLIKLGEQGAYKDFTSAEQVFLALESLSYDLGDRQTLLPALDALYNSVADEYRFDHGAFVKALGKINN